MTAALSTAAFSARLPREFYTRDALVVARALIGTYLVHGGDGGAPLSAGPSAPAPERVARIVETEAYRGPTDLACHARAGLTKRTATLFGPPGHAYVFLIYGMHECFNVVCFGEGKGHAVLVRGVEPVCGVPEHVRTDGPGRLTSALAITRKDDTVDLVASSRLWIAPRTKRPRISTSPRVGVAYAGEIAEAPWRFYDPTSKHVSRPSPKYIGLGAGSTQK